MRGNIPEGQFINGGFRDFNVLQRPVQQVAVHGFDFLRLDNRPRFEVRNRNVAGSVRDVDSVRGSDIFAAGVRNLERDAGERFVRRAVHVLMHQQSGRCMLWGKESP